jgi:hypothetical protein
MGDATVSLSGDANVLELLCLGKSDFDSSDIYVPLCHLVSVVYLIFLHDFLAVF